MKIEKKEDLCDIQTVRERKEFNVGCSAVFVANGATPNAVEGNQSGNRRK